MLLLIRLFAVSLGIVLPALFLSNTAVAQSCRVGAAPESPAKFNAMNSAELVTIVNQNIRDQSTIQVSRCNIFWETSYSSFSVDARSIIDSGCEMFEGSLIFHPLTQKDAVTVRSKRSDGKIMKIDFGSFHIVNNDPSRYWKVKLAFDALVKQIASTCK